MLLANSCGTFLSFIKETVFRIIIRKVHDQWDLRISQNATTGENLFSIPVSAEILNEIHGKVITFQRERSKSISGKENIYTHR